MAQPAWLGGGVPPALATSTGPSGVRVWTALSVVYVVWGSTYLAILYVVESLPPLLSAGIRFLTASALLAIFLLVRRGRQAFRATRRQLCSAVGIGLLLLVGGNGGITLAERHHLPSGLAALLVAGVPLFVVLLRALGSDRPAARTLLGVGIGFVGLAVLLLPGARPQGVSWLVAATVVGSSFLWSLGSFAASRTELPPDALLTTVVEMTGGGVGLLLAGALLGERLHPDRVELSSVLGLGYLIVFGSVLAFTAYSWLLGVAPVSKVATYAYVNPVVAVLLGAAFVHEHLTATTVLGGGLTLVAVAVVVAAEGRRRPGPVGLPADAPLAQAPEERQGRERSPAT